MQKVSSTVAEQDLGRVFLTILFFTLSNYSVFGGQEIGFTACMFYRTRRSRDDPSVPPPFSVSGEVTF